MNIKIFQVETPKGTLFYIREMPHIQGKTLEATAITADGALWQQKRFEENG